MNKDLLISKAKEVRKDIINSIYYAKSGHPGGSLSCADILTYLYFEKMNIDVNNKDDLNRDRFVLSKGHAAPALYSVLAERGFINKEELLTLRKTGALLQGHPDSKHIAGVDVSTGSLGQGFSNAAGMAIGLKKDNRKSKVYVLLGDGELQEGIVWEAAMFAGHYKLDNLVAIVDYNGLQIDGKNEDVMTVTPIGEKFKAFGFNILFCDGHDFNQINRVIEEAEKANGNPSLIVAKTIKGKGVSFMEDNAGWHGTAPNKEEWEKALQEIEKGVE